IKIEIHSFDRITLIGQERMMRANAGARDHDFLRRERSRGIVEFIDRLDVQRPADVSEETCVSAAARKMRHGAGLAKPSMAKYRHSHSSMRTISGDEAITQSPPRLRLNHARICKRCWPTEAFLASQRLFET